jgi:hypothetical protein
VRIFRAYFYHISPIFRYTENFQDCFLQSLLRFPENQSNYYVGFFSI